MTTEATAQAAAGETKKSHKRREVRTYNVRLDGQGAEQLHIRALRTKTGWRSEVIHRAGKKGPNVRGASAEHSSVEQAKAAVDKLAAEAVKVGWRVRDARSFSRKADAFDSAHLPAPGKAAKK